MSGNYDVAVLGGGPGGYVAALTAARMGGKVVLVDEGGLGGTCLNRGCIPTKALLASAEVFHEVKGSEDFGIKLEAAPVFDIAAAMERKDRIVAELASGIEKLLARRSVVVLKGRGRLEGPNRLTVVMKDDSRVEVKARAVIVATGSVPAALPGFECDGTAVLASDHALDLRELPKSLIVIGGGVIGCEFATFFSLLGVKVELVEAMERILLQADQALARQVASGLKRRGVKIHTKVRLSSVGAFEGGARACFEDGRSIVAEKALIAVGRRPCTEDIGLEALGVRTGDKGEILVDRSMRTNVPSLFAVGDVTGEFQLAHAASAQGVVAGESAMGADVKFDGRVMPSVTFTSPELAQVGLTEQECRRQGLDYEVGRFMFGANGKAKAMGKAAGTIKLVVTPGGSEILGCHVLGPHASDIVAEAALAMRNGLGAEAVARTVHAHPTLSEVLHEAAEAALGRPLHQA